MTVTIAGGTAIEWADFSWNPWQGCEKVSPACAHCYAEKQAARFTQGLWGAGHAFRFASESYWRRPLSWSRNAPRILGRRPRVFCASMADVFEERPDLDAETMTHYRGNWPTSPRAAVLDLIVDTPELDWLLLTKRPEFARDWLREWYGGEEPLPNLWLGVSIENSRYTWRADVLREIPAAIRFISAEPLLGSLFEDARSPRPTVTPTLDERQRVRARLELEGIDWVIAGGESGPGARRTNPGWLREILEAVDEQLICHDHQVALFVKQLGRVLGRELGCADQKGNDTRVWPPDLVIREHPRSAA